MTELTQEQTKTLADRWMAMPDFVWAPGMRDGESGCIVGYDELGTLWLVGDGEFDLQDSDACWPDLRHAGTLGFAVAAMRALLNPAGDPGGYHPKTITRPGAAMGLEADVGWAVEHLNEWLGIAATEAEAVIATMEEWYRRRGGGQ